MNEGEFQIKICIINEEKDKKRKSIKISSRYSSQNNLHF